MNDAGYEAGNDFAALEADLPLLQDGARGGGWAAWGVEYRDVVVLDPQNRKVAVFNLTDRPLARFSAEVQDYVTDEDNMDALRALLLDAAKELAPTK